jgi:hypothetical protein
MLPQNEAKQSGTTRNFKHSTTNIKTRVVTHTQHISLGSWDTTACSLFTDLGFVVLAFPCNQFGQQEPDPEEEIKKQVTQKFGVTFPLMSKVRTFRLVESNQNK